MKADKSDIRSHWQLARQTFTMDALGNQTDVESGRFQSTFNKANEILTRNSKGNEALSYLVDMNGLGTSFADTTSFLNNWSIIGTEATGSFSVSSYVLRIGSGSSSLVQDTIDGYSEPSAQSIVLVGEAIGPASLAAAYKIPTGAPSGSEAGIVFGYKSGADYWLAVSALDGKDKLYHVQNGTKNLIKEVTGGTTAGSDAGLMMTNSRKTCAWPFAYDFPDGYPSGRVGFFTNVSDTTVGLFQVKPMSRYVDMGGRWRNGGENAITSNRLTLWAYYGNDSQPFLLRNLQLQKFQSTFSVRRESTWGGNFVDAGFVFNAGDQDDYYALCVKHQAGYKDVTMRSYRDGAYYSTISGTFTSANYPSLGDTDVLWCRVESNGTTITMKAVSSATAPSEGTWTGTAACYTTSGCSLTGGGLGFSPPNGYGYVDDLTIKSYNANTSAFDVTEHVDEFTTSGSNYVEETIDYDRNGNLIYDGVQKYTYDAWNRLTGIAHAYRSGGTVYAGQTSTTMKYDGKGRRIQKAVANTGSWDCTFKYFYDGDSNIETRNGSDTTIKELVWGTNYIDELVQIKSYDTDVSALVARYVCQDANYNVLGIVSTSGGLVERYEYTPYGQRKVFFNSGSNDGKCYAPTLASRRTSTYDAWGECEFGHQGLMHDEEVELVYNRARHLHPGLGRFAQRDPLEYIDSKNLAEYTFSSPVAKRDSSGLLVQNGTICLGTPVDMKYECPDTDSPKVSCDPKSHQTKEVRDAEGWYKQKVKCKWKSGPGPEMECTVRSYWKCNCANMTCAWDHVDPGPPPREVPSEVKGCNEKP